MDRRYHHPWLGSGWAGLAPPGCSQLATAGPTLVFQNSSGSGAHPSHFWPWGFCSLGFWGCDWEGRRGLRRVVGEGVGRMGGYTL